LTFRPAVFDADIAVLDVTGLTQALAERGNDMSECHGRSAVEEANYRQLRLLRVRRKRPPNCRAAKRDNKFSPSDVDCHATLPGGHAHAMEGMISRFNRAVCDYFVLGGQPETAEIRKPANGS
jgi:hypothetical protein